MSGELGHPEGQPPKDVTSLPVLVLCRRAAHHWNRRRITILQCTKLIFDVRVSQMEVNGFWGSTWRISRVILRVQWGVRIWGTSKIANIF